jgi:two-component sensor histidine kinase
MLPPTHIITLAPVVNELIMNTIKHAFQEGKSGTFKVSNRKTGADDVAIVVGDKIMRRGRAPLEIACV